MRNCWITLAHLKSMFQVWNFAFKIQLVKFEHSSKHAKKKKNYVNRFLGENKLILSSCK